MVFHAFPNKPYVSLEDPDQLEFAEEDTRGFFTRFPDGAVLDEVQRCAPLFSYIQTIIDSGSSQGLFILTESRQFGLVSKINQTLARRVELIHLFHSKFGNLLKRKGGFQGLFDLLFKGFVSPPSTTDTPPLKTGMPIM